MRGSRFVVTPCLLGLTCWALAGCSGNEKTKDAEFHTSGSPEADQRAEEQVAKVQQLRGEGLNESDVHRSLYDRLGKDDGIKTIVSDWIDRSLADPRVNFKRQGVTSGGVLGIDTKSEAWTPNPANIEQLKKHFVQFISVATGGPAHYDGREMKSAHQGMGISNAEFDAMTGDLKAALDAHQVETQEQKELLAVIESTRPQIVEER